jgi:hypothetical protein
MKKTRQYTQAARLGGAVGTGQHRHELGPVPVHVLQPGLVGV